MFEIQIRDVIDVSFGELCHNINTRSKNCDGVELRALKYWDVVVAANGIPHKNECGIYWFSDTFGTIEYVGVNASKSFVERVGGHFSCGSDHGQSAFLNALYRNGFDEKRDLPTNLPKELYDKASTYRIGYLRIFNRSAILKNNGKPTVDQIVKEVGKLERSLIFHLGTRLNSQKSPNPKNFARAEDKIRDLLPTVAKHAF